MESATKFLPESSRRLLSRPLHPLAIIRLAAAISEFVRVNHFGWVVLGPIDVLFAEGDYLEPDLISIRRERAGIISDRGIEAAPNLVVEVLSDSTAERDRGIKQERYKYFGVLTYWIVVRRCERSRFID